MPVSVIQSAGQNSKGIEGESTMKKETSSTNDERIMQEIGARIREKRNERGLSQEKLAEAVDVNMRLISRYELGETEPKAIVFLKIAQALAVPVEALIPDELKRPSRQNTALQVDTVVKEVEKFLETKLNSIIDDM